MWAKAVPMQGFCIHQDTLLAVQGPAVEAPGSTPGLLLINVLQVADCKRLREAARLVFCAPVRAGPVLQTCTAVARPTC